MWPIAGETDMSSGARLPGEISLTPMAQKSISTLPRLNNTISVHCTWS